MHICNSKRIQLMFARLELLSYVASHNKYYKYDDKKKKKSRRNPIYLFTHQVSVSLLIKFEQTYTISLSNLQNYLNTTDTTRFRSKATNDRFEQSQRLTQFPSLIRENLISVHSRLINNACVRNARLTVKKEHVAGTMHDRNVVRQGIRNKRPTKS